jgi:hypothetical protein
LLTVCEIGSPEAIVGSSVEVIKVSVLDYGEEIKTTYNRSGNIAVLCMESVNIMIIANAGVIDNTVVITHRRDELIRHLGVVFLVALYLVKSSAVGILDLIVEVFSAELGLTTEISDKANLIAAGSLASVDTVLLGSCSETCDLGGFAGGIHIEIEISVSTADIFAAHAGKALGLGLINIHGIKASIVISI